MVATSASDDKLGSAIEEAQRKAENDQRWAAHKELHDVVSDLREAEVQLRWGTHQRDHELLSSIVSETERRLAERVASALKSHEREHALQAEAAHEHHASHATEHHIHDEAHTREHVLQSEAVAKVEKATEARFASANQFREQLREQAQHLASSERVDSLQKEMDRRFEELRNSVTNLEKGDVKAEGRTLGQGAVVAIIVTAISLAGALTSIIVLVANFVTKGP